MGKSAFPTRWILGFDNTNATQARLAHQLVALSEGTLIAEDLGTLPMHQYRAQVFDNEAPWDLTLLAIDETGIRAWTGRALVLRLGRLLGPRTLWRLFALLGMQLDRSSTPASPERRSVLRAGLAGGLATAALMAEASRPRQLSDFVAVAAETAASTEVAGESVRDRWLVKDLSGNAFDRLKDQAEDTRDFRLLRDYFANDKDWDAKGREATEISFRNRRVRRGYAQVFKRPGEAKWVHVIYAEDDGGRTWSRGYIWRNGKITDTFYVKNGNIRNDDGRVDSDTVIAEAPWDNITECDVDTVLCGGVVIGGCAYGTLAVVLTCGPTIGLTCGAGTLLTVECGIVGNDALRGCREWASEGKC